MSTTEPHKHKERNIVDIVELEDSPHALQSSMGDKANISQRTGNERTQKRTTLVSEVLDVDSSDHGSPAPPNPSIKKDPALIHLKKAVEALSGLIHAISRTRSSRDKKCILLNAAHPHLIEHNLAFPSTEGQSEDIKVLLNTIYWLVDNTARRFSDRDWSIWTKPYDPDVPLWHASRGQAPSEFLPLGKYRFTGLQAKTVHKRYKPYYKPLVKKLGSTTIARRSSRNAIFNLPEGLKAKGRRRSPDPSPHAGEAATSGKNDATQECKNKTRGFKAREVITIDSDEEEEGSSSHTKPPEIAQARNQSDSGMRNYACCVRCSVRAFDRMCEFTQPGTPCSSCVCDNEPCSFMYNPTRLFATADELYSSIKLHKNKGNVSSLMRDLKTNDTAFQSALEVVHTLRSIRSGLVRRIDSELVEQCQKIGRTEFLQASFNNTEVGSQILGQIQRRTG